MYDSPPGSRTREVAGGSALEALTRLVPRFLSPRTRACHVFADGGEDVADAETLLFGLVDVRNVHVVGSSWLARQMRDLLRAGRVAGWGLHELPETTTSVYALFPYLPNATITILEKYPFATVEEIVATPDEGLRDLRRLGATGVAAIRAACAHPEVAEFSTPALDRAVPARMSAYEDRLLPAYRDRYTSFLGRLAQLALPDNAVARILESINAEPLPPADPTVIAVLEAAGATDLLAYYSRTHRLTDSTAGDVNGSEDSAHAFPMS